MDGLTLPIFQGLGEGLLIPAPQVTALLRALGEEWLGWAAEDGSDLDGGTTGSLVLVLREVADQIDVECIAAASEE